MLIHPRPDLVTAVDSNQAQRRRVRLGTAAIAVFCIIAGWAAYYFLVQVPHNQLAYYHDHPDAFAALNRDQIPSVFMDFHDSDAEEAWITAKINLARKNEKDPAVLALLSSDSAMSDYWYRPDEFIALAQKRAQAWEAFAANPNHAGFHVGSDGKIVSINQTVNRDILGTSVPEDKGTFTYTFGEIDRLLDVTKATADNQATIDSLRLTANSNR